MGISLLITVKEGYLPSRVLGDLQERFPDLMFNGIDGRRFFMTEVGSKDQIGEIEVASKAIKVHQIS